MFLTRGLGNAPFVNVLKCFLPKDKFIKYWVTLLRPVLGSGSTDVSIGYTIVGKEFIPSYLCYIRYTNYLKLFHAPIQFIQFLWGKYDLC